VAWIVASLTFAGFDVVDLRDAPDVTRGLDRYRAGPWQMGVEIWYVGLSKQAMVSAS